MWKHEVRKSGVPCYNNMIKFTEQLPETDNNGDTNAINQKEKEDLELGAKWSGKRGRETYKDLGVVELKTVRSLKEVWEDWESRTLGDHAVN